MQLIDFGQAVRDLYYLLSRNYGETAALKAVGDRYRLVKRQRDTLRRIVSPQSSIRQVKDRQISAKQLADQPLLLDGFNVLILGESLLSAGYVFECLDGTYRDIASLHGSYHRIAETAHAIALIGRHLHELTSRPCCWYLDKPVSNSGRLKSILLQTASEHDWLWEVHLVRNADDELIHSTDGVVISSDRLILTSCRQWFNFSKMLAGAVSNPHLISLADLGVEANLP